MTNLLTEPLFSMWDVEESLYGVWQLKLNQYFYRHFPVSAILLVTFRLLSHSYKTDRRYGSIIQFYKWENSERKDLLSDEQQVRGRAWSEDGSSTPGFEAGDMGGIWNSEYLTITRENLQSSSSMGEYLWQMVNVSMSNLEQLHLFSSLLSASFSTVVFWKWYHLLSF